MNRTYLIWGLAAASLLIPASASVVRTEGAQHASHGSQNKGPLLEAVRQATERFRDLNHAIAAGYIQNGGCVSGPEEGAMGVHFAYPSRFDDRLSVDEPEVLVYEPRNGRLHLVAVEYVTPAAAWELTHDDFDLPHLMGHMFHFAPGPNRYGPPSFYELHVWAWKDNPRGSFADWNPTVSCDTWATPLAGRGTSLVFKW
jgi:hypothetical protein